MPTVSIIIHIYSHTVILSNKVTCNSDDAATSCRKTVDQDHRETTAPLKVRLLNPTLSVHDANPLEPMEAEQHGSQGW